MRSLEHKTVRVALLGAGRHSESQHAASLRQFKKNHPDDVELAAVCDLNGVKAERIAREYGATVTGLAYRFSGSCPSACMTSSVALLCRAKSIRSCRVAG